MIVVVDASVALKWFLKGPDERDAGNALDILEAIDDGRIEMLQPPHFLAEVAGGLGTRGTRYGVA